MMKTFTALIALFFALAASAQEKFEIRGFSWHLSAEEMVAHAESLGLECHTSSRTHYCGDPDDRLGNGSVRTLISWYWYEPGWAGIEFTRTFTNTKSMTMEEVARFLLDNKPISDLPVIGQNQMGDPIYEGRAEDGQMVTVWPGGITLRIGTLGDSGPTM